MSRSPRRFTKRCPSCGQDSQDTYRCEDCGHDLAGDTTTAGREGSA